LVVDNVVVADVAVVDMIDDHVCFGMYHWPDFDY